MTRGCQSTSVTRKAMILMICVIQMLPEICVFLEIVEGWLGRSMTAVGPWRSGGASGHSVFSQLFGMSSDLLSRNGSSECMLRCRGLNACTIAFHGTAWSYGSDGLDFHSM